MTNELHKKADEPAVSGKGLRDADIGALRTRYGYNELPEHHESLLVLYLKNFWGPLPWLLELMVLITYFSGNQVEALIIVILLFINSGINILQRRSADKALATLRKAIEVMARVERNGSWTVLSARELLPGDIVRIRAGDVVPADAKIIDGTVSVDLSSLTGESLPKDITVDDAAFSGSIVRRGEATVKIGAIGKETRYGKTTELLQVAHPPTHMEKVVFAIIKYFFILNMCVAVGVIIFGILVHAPSLQIINYVIVLMIMSVPIAFPTMFAVAQTYGALQLNRGDGDQKDGGRRVLVRRLGAVQEAAVVDVLCSDKTGTLTQNKLAVSEMTHYGASDEARMLMYASAASDVSDENSIDQAILQKASTEVVATPNRVSFTPFDPSTKRTEAEIVEGDKHIKIEMGLPNLLLKSEVRFAKEALADVARMSGQGLRVLAVVADVGGAGKECAGLIGLSDPIRPDAPALIKELSDLGVRVVMITGDGRITAQAVARQLGLVGEVFTPAELHKNPQIALSGAVFAEAYPEDKLTIIETLQKAGHSVGMTGDGVNDAPALHRAEVGIAVLGATEVAKQAASFILTTPGLEGVRRVVTAGRRVYTRIRTWALNKVIKSVESLLIATVIFVITHSYILSPLIAILILLSNDFVTISVAVDHTKPIPHPTHWNIRNLIIAAFCIALVPYVFTMGLYLIAQHLGYPFNTIRTVAYLSLIYLGATTLLAIRAWPFSWSVRPKGVLIGALIFSLVFSSLIAGFGIAIAPLPLLFWPLIAGGAILSFFLIEAVKRIRGVQKLLDIS